MENVVRAKVVPIGNSRGVRIPKVWLEQLGFADEVEMAVQDGRLVITRPSHSREGWAEAFRRMAEAGDDTLLDESTPTRWENEEWEW
jgi:antitoxin MazE